MRVDAPRALPMRAAAVYSIALKKNAIIASRSVGDFISLARAGASEHDVRALQNRTEHSVLASNLEDTMRALARARDDITLFTARRLDDIAKRQQLQLRSLMRHGRHDARRKSPRQLGSRLEDEFGVDLHNPKIVETMRQFAETNAALIKDVTHDQLQRIGDATVRAIQEKRTKGDLVADIRDAEGITLRRAQFIASDQAMKLTSKLTEVICVSAGVLTYTWQTMLDDRVRPEHADREGEVFDWNDPPEDGHPGEPAGCRCMAAPNFDESELDDGEE
jgi:SPP1 gp7 family putative phage head morphogenesis protein